VLKAYKIAIGVAHIIKDVIKNLLTTPAVVAVNLWNNTERMKYNLIEDRQKNPIRMNLNHAKKEVHKVNPLFFPSYIILIIDMDRVYAISIIQISLIYHSAFKFIEDSIWAQQMNTKHMRNKFLKIRRRNEPQCLWIWNSKLMDWWSCERKLQTISKISHRNPPLVRPNSDPKNKGTF